MNAQPAKDPELAPLACPSCGWEWRFLPRPLPLQGYQVVQYSCPNRHCKQRHWLVLHRLSFAPALQWRIIRRVPCLGQHAEAMRRSLQQIPELDEDTVELIVALHELQPLKDRP